MILIALCGLLMAATFGLWAYCSKLKSEQERLDGNQTALLEKVEFYQTESGKSAASVPVSYPPLDVYKRQEYKTLDVSVDGAVK